MLTALLDIGETISSILAVFRFRKVVPGVWGEKQKVSTVDVSVLF